ncbi:hypothetical protein ACLB2K_041640 [Fragaria x ananassa]
MDASAKSMPGHAPVLAGRPHRAPTDWGHPSFNTTHRTVAHKSNCKFNKWDDETDDDILTASFMSDMSKESCNLPFIVISETGGEEIGVRAEGIEKSLSGVEALAGTVSASLVDDGIEEVGGHDIGH